MACKADLDCIFAAVKTNPGAFRYYTYLRGLDDDYSKGREFIKSVLEINGLIVKELYWLKNDKLIVLCAVQQNPFAFEYASDEMKRNKDVVRGAAWKSLAAIESVFEEFREDSEIQEIIKKRVEEDPVAYCYSSHEVKLNKKIVLKHLQNKKISLEQVPVELRDDREVVMAALDISYSDYLYASKTLQKDQEIIAKTLECMRIQEENYCIHSCPELLQLLLLINQSREFALSVLETFHHGFQYVNPELAGQMG